MRGTSLPPLETHAHWLALDASAWALEGDPALRNLLRYVKEEVVAEGDGLLRRIDDEVARLNRDPEWRKAVITYEQKYGKHIREEGKAEGLQEGRAEGRAEAYSEVLELADGLKAIGRQDDLDRALRDEGFRREVLAEIRLKS